MQQESNDGFVPRMTTLLQRFTGLLMSKMHNVFATVEETATHATCQADGHKMGCTVDIQDLAHA